MNAKITIALCTLVAAMNHASAAIVDVNMELRAFASSVAIPGDPDYTDTDERRETFSGYGSFSVAAETGLTDPELLPASAGVTASVQPHAIGIGTYSALGGSSFQGGSSGTATATVNFNLSEAGVWSAKPFTNVGTSHGPAVFTEAVVSLLREGQEVYRQDCSVDAEYFCVPYYEDNDGNIIPIPEYVGRSLELQQGDYTLLLSTMLGPLFSNDSLSGGFAFDLQVVPVPAALPLFISALAAFGIVGWRRR